MCKGSLHLPCVIETQLSLKTAASLALRWRQLCYYAPCSMKSGGALLDFQLSVDFLTTTVSKHLHAIPLYHPLGFLVQSLNTSLLLPSLIQIFGSWLTVFLYRGLLASFLAISRMTEVIHIMLVSVLRPYH